MASIGRVHGTLLTILHANGNVHVNGRCIGRVNVLEYRGFCAATRSGVI
jgi:hypothetical protein